jgi:hypothetical protein
MNWRLIKEFNSDIVIITIFKDVYIPHARVCRKFISNVPHVCNFAPQAIGKVYFETF